MMTGHMTYYIIIGAITLVSSLVSGKLKKKFAFYSKKQLRNGLTGREIAEKMLADHGITDVEVISTKGQLTDHYLVKLFMIKPMHLQQQLQLTKLVMPYSMLQLINT